MTDSVFWALWPLVVIFLLGVYWLVALILTFGKLTHARRHQRTHRDLVIGRDQFAKERRAGFEQAQAEIRARMNAAVNIGSERRPS